MAEGGAPRPDRRAERGEATRAALVRAARDLFSERGYGGVGTNEVVERAGVTRGAMYHHFSEKKDLFRAVYEQTEQELIGVTLRAIEGIDDPWERLVVGVRTFFDVCEDPKLRQIGLVDAPAVLGWQEWRDIGKRYVFGAVTFVLQDAMDKGVLREADTTTLAHLFIAALGEAALMLAGAEDPAAARDDVEATLLAMLEGMRP